MKILLIYPYFLAPRIHEEEIAALPMGILYIGAMLKSEGHDVRILDWHDAKGADTAIRETLVSRQPDLIGISIVHANRWGGIEIARMAKQLFPDVPVVFGGIGATFLWRHLLTHFSAIDYIVLGEGEHTIARLVKALEDGAATGEIAGLPGLALRSSKGPVRTADAPLIENLDELPPPARYFDFQHLSLTRGCPGRCTFCGSPRFWRRRVRSHSTDYLVDQIALLVERGITFFYLSDDTFTLNAERVIALCRKIIDRGLSITWQAISKVSAVNDEMLFWMRKAGCVQISYGVESGSPEIRKRLCKDIGHDQIVHAFERTVAHGILARAYFIYGAPGESWATIEQTLDLMRQIKPLSAIFYIMDLFPGTALYEDYKARSGVDDDIWLQAIEDLLYFETDPSMDRETVLAFGRRLRESFDRALPEFARRIVLKDDAELYPEQADFLSRLGLTFSHGDYARIQSSVDPGEVAKALFERALQRHPDHRAFWGLALLHQRNGDSTAAMAVLKEGLRHHPHSQQLNICAGIGYANAGQYHQAMAHLSPFDRTPEAVPHIVRCLRALGRHREAATYGSSRS
jgi:anaerobic magnesium-protoporphyrin IX monomethyl ester cyclase